MRKTTYIIIGVIIILMISTAIFVSVAFTPMERQDLVITDTTSVKTDIPEMKSMSLNFELYSDVERIANIYPSPDDNNYMVVSNGWKEYTHVDSTGISVLGYVETNEGIRTYHPFSAKSIPLVADIYINDNISEIKVTEISNHFKVTLNNFCERQLSVVYEDNHSDQNSRNLIIRDCNFTELSLNGYLNWNLISSDIDTLRIDDNALASKCSISDDSKIDNTILPGNIEFLNNPRIKISFD